MADPVRRSEKPHAVLPDFILEVKITGVKPHQFQKLIDKGEIPPLPEETQDIIDRFLQYRDRLPELIASLETVRSGLRHVARALQTIVGELLLHVLRTEVHQLSDLRARVEVELPKALASAKLRERYKGLRAECLPDIHAVMDVVFPEVSTDNAHFYRLNDLYRMLQSCQEEIYLIRLLRQADGLFRELRAYFRDREDEKPKDPEDATCGSYPLPESRKRFHVASLRRAELIIERLRKKLEPLRAEVLCIQFHTQLVIGINIIDYPRGPEFSKAKRRMLKKESDYFSKLLPKIGQHWKVPDQPDGQMTSLNSVVAFTKGCTKEGKEVKELYHLHQLTIIATYLCETQQADHLETVINSWTDLAQRSFEKHLVETLTHERDRSRAQLEALERRRGAVPQDSGFKARLKQLRAWETVLSKVVSRFEDGTVTQRRPSTAGGKRAEQNEGVLMMIRVDDSNASSTASSPRLPT